MKKRFKSRKKLNNLKKIIYLIFILIGFFLSYLYFYYKVRNMISSISSGSKDFILDIEKQEKERTGIKTLKVGFNKQIDSSYIKSSLLSNIKFDNTSVTDNNNDDTSQITDKSNTKEVLNSTKPIIYIYSTHDTEGYASSYFNIYNIKPDVKIASYYLQEKLSDLGLNTIVEKRMIKDALNKNNWVYKDSYKASRIYLENTYQNNTSLKYFIDLHRDSSLKSKTTTTIDGKSYARVMLLVGLEHDNYNANLKVATDINNLIKAKYPSLTRGIYKKSGPGVNGIYNQDFNSNCILIELGGQYNTMLEVSNTIDILAKILYDYIGENI